MANKIEQAMYVQFAAKWRLDAEQVEYIHYIVKSTGNKHGKSSRVLLKFGVKLSPRQLRYFVHKVRLSTQYGMEIKNYSDMVSRKS